MCCSCLQRGSSKRIAAHLVAAEPSHDGPFLANLVLIPIRDGAYPDPLIGIAEIPGSVVLGSAASRVHPSQSR